jgi:hypothetical protein
MSFLVIVLRNLRQLTLEMMVVELMKLGVHIRKEVAYFLC